MADKKVVRPIGLEPSWSNDLNLDDPGESWDATPTKVEPGAGKRDDGFLPDEDIPAQHVNHLLNELGQWVQFFSDIQVQNWINENTIPTLSGDTNTGNGITWDDATLQWIVTSDPDGIDLVSARSPNGTTWFYNGTAAISSTSWGYCFSKPSGDTPSHAGQFVVACGGDGGGGPIFGPGNGPDVAVNRSGAWTNYTLNAGDDTVASGKWDPSNQLLIIGGHDDSGPPVEPVFHSSPSNVISWTRLKPSFSNSETVVDIATDGQGLTLAIGDQTDGDTWTSTNGTSWTLRTTTIDDMQCCAYNADLGLWMILTDTEAWTSSDAINWSLVGTHGTNVAPRTLVTQGSLWVVGTSETKIMYSTDAGATWRVIHVASTAPSNAGIDGLAYSDEMRCFAVAVSDAANGGHITKSLSVGTGALLGDGTRKDIPTVT